jgi:hypothetical protein
MQSDYDLQREAEAAMRQAVHADGFERQRSISLATAWQELASTRPSFESSRSEQSS